MSPNPEPPRSTPGPSELLEQVRGWPGLYESLEPGAWPAEAPTPEPCAPFAPEAFATAGALTSAFADGLVCSVPELLPAGAFALHVGCRLSPHQFTQVSLLFDNSQQLSRWELRRFEAPSG